MKKGFTLLEMLIVIGIIITLMGVTITSYSKVSKTAERAKALELVSNVATALTALHETNSGFWPKTIRANGATDGRLDETVAYPLAKAEVLSLSADADSKKLVGYDRLGILTPWAVAVMKRKGLSASLSTPVGNTGRTIKDHILHFAVDLDGDGIIEGANVGGESVNIRATAAVWCIGKSGGTKNGNPWPYSQGLRKDDIYSWAKGQTMNVK